MSIPDNLQNAISPKSKSTQDAHRSPAATQPSSCTTPRTVLTTSSSQDSPKKPPLARFAPQLKPLEERTQLHHRRPRPTALGAWLSDKHAHAVNFLASRHLATRSQSTLLSEADGSFSPVDTKSVQVLYDANHCVIGARGGCRTRSVGG